MLQNIFIFYYYMSREKRQLGIILKPLSSYPEEVQHDIEDLSFQKNGAIPFGSFVYRFQKYPGDVDLIEVYKECCSKNQVIRKFILSLKKVIGKITSHRLHYMTEFKAGVDERFNIDYGQLAHGLFYYNPDLMKITDEFYKKHLIKEEDYEKIKTIWKKIKKLTMIQAQDAYDVISNIYRNYYILRWTLTDLQNGYIDNRGRRITLFDALHDYTNVKIDTVSLVNGRFIEITNFICLSINNKGTETGINYYEQCNDIERIATDVEKLYYSNYFYSPFKCVKRMFAYANAKNIIYVLERLLPLLTSNISLLYQIKSEIDTIMLLLERLPRPPYIAMNKQLNGMKNRFATIIELPENILLEFNEKINKFPTTKQKSKRIELLKEISKKIIKPYLNFFTIEYLNSIGMNPPPADVLPGHDRYDRSIVRKPTDNPVIEF
jgi:hypothetical protein